MQGLQLINVYFRGSLIFDIFEMRNVNHEKFLHLKTGFTKLIFFKDTLLYEITDRKQLKLQVHITRQ